MNKRLGLTLATLFLFSAGFAVISLYQQVNMEPITVDTYSNATSVGFTSDTGNWMSVSELEKSSNFTVKNIGNMQKWVSFDFNANGTVSNEPECTLDGGYDIESKIYHHLNGSALPDPLPVNGYTSEIIVLNITLRTNHCPMNLSGKAVITNIS